MYLLGPFYQWLVRLFDGRVNHLPLVRLFILCRPRNHPVSRMHDRLPTLFYGKRRNRLEVGALTEIYLSSILYCSRSLQRYLEARTRRLRYRLSRIRSRYYVSCLSIVQIIYARIGLLCKNIM